MSSSSVLGFTEAELGFFLALLCLVLWVAAAVPEEKPPHPKSVATISADSAKVLADKIAALRRALDSLKSPILPSCKAKQLVAGPLLTLTAVSAQAYRFNADTIAFNKLEPMTASARAQARVAGCVHEIRLGFLRSMSAPDYEMSRRRIGALGIRLLPGPISDQ